MTSNQIRLQVSPALAMDDQALLAIIVTIIGIFAFLRIWVAILDFRGFYNTQIVGPHVVETEFRTINNQAQTRYVCKYCGRVLERPEFFHDKDCEEFEYNQ